MAKSYNKYQYETSPRKLEPYYAPKKKNNQYKKTNTEKKIIKNKQEEKKIKEKIIVYLMTAFAILFAISYQNAKIDENFEQVQTLKTELAEIEKESTQLEATIESNLNLTTLEQQARNLLGMQKLTNKQTEYVSLPKTDYIETASEKVVIEENNGLVKKIASFISELFK